MAESGRHKVKTAHILRNSLMKRLMADHTINPAFLARLIAYPVYQRFEAAINALADNRTDCFDESMLRVQESFTRFFRDISARKKNGYEKYCEMLLEKIFNNGCHIHGIDIYQAFLVVFAIARDRLLVNDIERVELLITWTSRFFENYTIDEWIEEQGGWEKLAAEPFVPPAPQLVSASAKEIEQVGMWPSGDDWEFAPGANDDLPRKRVTNKGDCVEDYESNISIPQTITGAQQSPFYGATLQQPHVTNPQQPYMVNLVQPYVVSVSQPYFVTAQHPHVFVASQFYTPDPQHMVNPQQPYPQLPYTVNPYQPIVGNPQQPYKVDLQQPNWVGNPESDDIAQKEVTSLEEKKMSRQFDETTINLFRNLQESVPQNYPPPLPRRLFPHRQRFSSQMPEHFSWPNHIYRYGPTQENAAAIQAQTQQISRSQFSTH